MPYANRTADHGFVQSLARGIAVLTAFGPGSELQTITQVANACGLTRAGARRILLTLQDLGYIAADGRQFYVTSRALELSRGYAEQSFWKQIQGTLQSISDQFNETTSAGVLEGYELVYTARVRSSRMLHLELRVGTHMPAHASSIGRVLLAALPNSELIEYLEQADFTKFTEKTVTDPNELKKLLHDVKKRGWCYVCGEMEEGISGISVPLVDPSGNLIAALNISTSPGRTTSSDVEKKVVPALLEAATEIRRSFWPRSQHPLWGRCATVQTNPED